VLIHQTFCLSMTPSSHLVSAHINLHSEEGSATYQRFRLSQPTLAEVAQWAREG
jgi:hypothetical protein